MRRVAIVSSLLALRACVFAKPLGVMFSIQPDKGGSPADNCGDGQPVTFDEASWAANKVDDAINSVWAAGIDDPNFDFHQAFSRKFGVSLYCPNIFTTCTGDPSSCSSLTGSVPEKKQGWLGIKALLSLQQQFLQFEKAITASMDGLSTDMVKFQQVFVTPSPPSGGNADHNVEVNAAFAVLTAIVGAIAAWLAVGAVPLTAAVAGGVGTLGGGLVSAFASYINDAHADSQSPPMDFSILTLSDAKVEMKQAMLYGLDKGHNATFSNGKAGTIQGPNITDVLRGGAFVSNLIPTVYAGEEGSLQGLVERILAAKLLESTWTAENTFLFHVKSVVTDDCNRWYTSDDQRTEVKVCDGDKGMFVLRSVTQDDTHFKRPYLVTPPGSTVAEVADVFSAYGLQLADVIQSAGEFYLNRGLVDSFANFLPDIFRAWVADPSNSIFKVNGMFKFAVCETQEYEWRDMNENRGSWHYLAPPCSCRKYLPPYLIPIFSISQF
ncbi:hypothetical protein GP486_004709 [Trichoglossum hirsutum]|uniref:Uncharacterized protein n=1 Tax=Trichoglossum hirsutum TaxID=265104 RepID=A0A9P8RNM0_9PEZI|nr:hypothetical protein GP486_004709 [Trichoglossum hirsutum]